MLLNVLTISSLLLLGGVPVLSTEKSTSPDHRNFINNIVDGIILIVTNILERDGYDPLDLPPYETSILHLGFVGKLQLQDCKLYNLATLKRNGDIEVTNLNSSYNTQASVEFEELKVNCTYKMTLLAILNKKGKAVVTLPSLSATADTDLETPSLKIELNDLELHNNGPIDVHLQGGLLDAVLSVVTEAISNLFKFQILNYIEHRMENELRQILEEIYSHPPLMDEL